MMAASDRTVVLGLGNPIRADDAVGLVVADALARLLEDDPIDAVTVRTSERGGFELVDLLSGFERAVIVDCLEVPGGQPGRVSASAPGEVAGSSRLVGGHEISVSEAIELGRLIGIPMPETIDILGIEGDDTMSLREGLTPAVAAAVGPLVARLERCLRTQGSVRCTFTPTTHGHLEN